MTRTVHQAHPPRVEYFLTDHGRILWPVFDALWRWGVGHLERQNSVAGHSDFPSQVTARVAAPRAEDRPGAPDISRAGRPSSA